MLRSVVFLGSKAAGLQALRALTKDLPAGCLRAVICPDDRDDPRCVYGDFAAFAEELRVPINMVAAGAELVARMREYRPTTAIVHGWYRIIPVAELPDIEFLGFHYAPLPRYRGNAPLVWQIIKGEKRLAASFFVLTDAMDEGDLLDQRFFDLADDEDIAVALSRANAIVEAMLADFVPGWLSGNIRRRAQPAVTPSYGGLRVPEDGRIDWTQSGAAVHNFVRAQGHPYPGAWTLLPDGRRMSIWKTRVEGREFFGQPGAVVEISANEVAVACGSGAVRVLSVQIEGEPEREARDVLKSLRVRLG
jgi:methionyl-tRNA formyltransferase